MTAQPTGTVTLLFTDVEGSTRVLQRLGGPRYAESLALHRRLLREAFDRHGGYEVDCEGDSFFVAFADAGEAMLAAAEAQEALAGADWPEGERFLVRMGMHSGEPAAEPPKYVGLDVHLAARIMAAGHGGQVLLSEATHGLAGTRGADLGEHRLKDFDEPVRLFQLGERRFPPLLTVANTNLVRPQTSFVGREDELAETLELLRSKTRLLTLTGPGGTGKTRLALEAALESIEGYPNGVWFVPLASVTDEVLIEPTIAQTVGARGDLREDLRSKRMLLVLDNLEQLREAAPIVADLLGACPDVRVLATSREHLNLSMEQEYPVPPLRPEAAAELFVHRARQRVPKFEPNGSVLEIARRLDGLPLAVELAAARVKVLTPKQMLDRLDRSLDVVSAGPRDLPDRQRTLRATIDWSYHLLDAAEQTLFARLAVFRGGCTLESAEAVVDADLDTMESLVDKSLLRHTGERFWMLETIREYATARLEADSHAEELRLRHANWHLALAEEIASPETIESNLDRMGLEHDNFRAALATYRRAPDSTSELRLVVHLARFWYGGGHFREGLLRLDAALGRADTVPDRDKLLAHYYAMSIALSRGELERAEAHARAELELARALEAHDFAVWALVALGTVARNRGLLKDARRSYEKALELAREAADDSEVAAATGSLGQVAFLEGDFERAAELAQRSIDLAAGDQWEPGVANGFVELALARLAQGRKAEASAAVRSAVDVLARVPYPEVAAALLVVAARILSADGLALPAARLLGAAAAIREEIGRELEPFEEELHDEVLLRLEEELGDEFAAARLEGAAMTSSEAIALVVEHMT